MQIYKGFKRYKGAGGVQTILNAIAILLFIFS